MLRVLTLFIAFLAFSQPVLADCAYETQEARITEQLAKEPGRPVLVVEGYPLTVFLANMKLYFDADDMGVNKVYIIEQLPVAGEPMGVHLFLLKDGCIVYYTHTLARLVAELLKSHHA